MSHPKVSTNLKLVKNEKKYWEYIRKLRNNDSVQHGFIDNVMITTEQQVKYMSRHSDDYFVCLCDGVPAGYVGEIDGDIRVATEPDWQRSGVGTFMIEGLMRMKPGSFAKVKVENIASISLFKKCGFKIKYVLMERE